MRKEFTKWMIEKDEPKKKKTVAEQYSGIIIYISTDYSRQNNKNIDLYEIDDIDFVNELVEKYGTGGIYKEIGNERKGAVRAAIKAYARFLKYKKMGHVSQNEINKEVNSILLESNRHESSNKNEFKKWMINQKNLETNTASSYLTGIKKISDDYNKINNKGIDIFKINDKILINGLVKEYGQGGKRKEIGNIGHAYVRAAIIKYAEFLEYENATKKRNNDLIDSNKAITINKSNNLENKKKKLLPKNKHEVLNKALDFMLPVLPEFIGNTLQEKDKNAWWQIYVIKKLQPNVVWDLPKNGTYEEYINKLDISLCIKIIISNWQNIFKYILKNIKLAWVHELIEIRNHIAHWSNETSTSYSFDSICHTINTMIMFMRSIDNCVADQILELKKEFEKTYENE